MHFYLHATLIVIPAISFLVGVRVRALSITFSSLWADFQTLRLMADQQGFTFLDVSTILLWSNCAYIIRFETAILWLVTIYGLIKASQTHLLDHDLPSHLTRHKVPVVVWGNYYVDRVLRVWRISRIQFLNIDTCLHWLNIEQIKEVLRTEISLIFVIVLNAEVQGQCLHFCFP